MNQNIKSATTAGILGIMLGAFGAHNWYLGEKGKGIAHICLMSGGIFIEIFASLIVPSIFGFARNFGSTCHDINGYQWYLGINRRHHHPFSG